jgi:hypothetical protein
MGEKSSREQDAAAAELDVGLVRVGGGDTVAVAGSGRWLACG